MGSFLFLGPTGTGKTRIVEALAESLVGDARAVIKIDCAEFQHSHEIAKLIGSPPGYLGHRETHPLLSQEVLNQYHTQTMKVSFVLFDEIEKASDALWNLLLGILDKATLTLGDNRRVDFSRAMIFMTSNLGAAKMVGKHEIGFAPEQESLSSLKDRNAKIGQEAARSKFTPEFLNRIDKICTFDPFTHEEIRQILLLELKQVQQRLVSSAVIAPFSFYLTEAAQDFIIEKGYSTVYNARHLRREVDRQFLHPLCNLIATQQVRGGDLVRVEHPEFEDQLDFYVEKEEMPAASLAQTIAVPALPLQTAVAAPAPPSPPVSQSRFSRFFR